MTLKEFEPIFRNDVAPIYINNQNTFDEDGIHGCLHIARSLIIGRVLSNTINAKGFNTNIDKISYAIAFHDSGRKANGIDTYEPVSRENCYNYLVANKIPDANYIANMILKKGNPDYNSLCAYDTDVLEIARPSTGIGISGFNRNYLRLKDVFRDSYNSIINEVFSFIIATEKDKHLYSDRYSLNNLIIYTDLEKEKYPVIHEASIS